MTTKEKYEMIDKSKVPSKTLEILEKMQKASTNFTNAEVNAKIDSALDRLIEGFKANNPSALITSTQAKENVKKERVKAEKKNEGKDLSDKKDTDDKTGLPKKDTIEERKDIIKKDSETDKEARERAKKELEKENEKAKDVIESQIEKLNRIILEDPSLQGFNTGTAATGGGKSTPIIDAERKALPRGARVSKKGWKNQYGASDGGRRYWENRENRSDRKSPEYETGKPYLADGGVIEPQKPIDKMNKLELMYFVSKIAPMKNFYPQSTEGGRVQAKKLYDEYLNRKKGTMNQGGYMADGGDVSDRLQKMREAYETLEMLVKSKIAMAIGIDEAVRIMEDDYAIHPFQLITGAVLGGLLEIDEINKDLVYSALMEAENVTEQYRDSGEGIGSSDITYFTKSVLDDAGYKTAFIDNTLKRVDANGNELVIDKYKMNF
jgi:phage-related minor tail protein